MSDLYNTEAVTRAEQQASLLRRIAAGERVNDQVDWENVVEEDRGRGRPLARQGHRRAHPGHAPRPRSASAADFPALDCTAAHGTS